LPAVLAGAEARGGQPGEHLPGAGLRHQTRSARPHDRNGGALRAQRREAHLRNLGIYELVRQAIREFGYELDDIMNVEPDAGLGTGGLGRLAACFLDSMATLGIPCYGYGIHY